jgi:hypothetical protein
MNIAGTDAVYENDTNIVQREIADLKGQTNKIKHGLD